MWIEKPGQGTALCCRADAAAACRAGARSSRTIISLEKGQYNPSLLLAYRIAELFGTTIEDLYCLAENKAEEDKKYEDL